ncbi:MAG TPA: IPT/TIG domain-containing protein [Bryobacteraceae bacterium]|nr:IPT/TIG domain-containing protein [Bryobacteraceae bacterium]
MKPRQNLLLSVCLLLGTSSALMAVPRMQLSSSTIGPVSIAMSASGPAQEVEVFNTGDGSLSLTVNSVVSWATPSLLAPRACTGRPGQCIPIRVALSTASLTAGRHSATVQVASPGALDGVQQILVIVQMGGGVPDAVNFFVAPDGSTETREIVTLGRAATQVTTQSGGKWLSIAVQGGSFNFAIPYRVKAEHLAGMAEGTYTGNVQFSGEALLPAERKTMGVTLRVTSQPVARPSSTSFRFRTPQNTPKQLKRVVINNASSGTLTLGAITAATTSGGNWLAATQLPGYNVVDITADPTGMQQGVYDGTVTIASNGVNGSLVIPVEIEVFTQGAPVVFPNSVLNNATFDPGDFVARGGIVAVKGEQLHFGEPIENSSLTWPTKLGETQVFVNNQPVPLYYVSYNQVNFLIPYETSPGEVTVRVERNGQPSANTTVRVANRKPRFLQFFDSGNEAYYALAQNASRNNSFPVPARYGIPNSEPARPGDTLVIYALGLGETNPPVPGGAAAPSSPLAEATGNWRVVFGTGVFVSGITVIPSYVGLVPGYVGLYQINVQVPADSPKGDRVAFYLQEDGGGTQQVLVAVQ